MVDNQKDEKQKKAAVIDAEILFLQRVAGNLKAGNFDDARSAVEARCNRLIQLQKMVQRGSK